MHARRGAAGSPPFMALRPLRYSLEYRTLWSVGRTILLVTMANQKIAEREVFALLDFAAPPVR